MLYYVRGVNSTNNIYYNEEQKKRYCEVSQAGGGGGGGVSQKNISADCYEIWYRCKTSQD